MVNRETFRCGCCLSLQRFKRYGTHGEGSIELKPGTVPKKQRPIHLTGERLQALTDLVDEWIADKKVEDGRSAWSTPTFVVAKKGGKWRGVADFRAVNECTVTDAHPLPRIEDILVRQGKRVVFSILDLKDAFHQVPLHKDSRHITCCSTPRGSKQWCVVVMGLKNGVAILQRVIDFCLEKVSDVADPYVDDIKIGTEWKGSEEATLSAHEADVRRLMEQLKEHHLVADRKKCQFLSRRWSFVGMSWVGVGGDQRLERQWPSKSGRPPKQSQPFVNFLGSQITTRHMLRITRF